MVFVLKFSLSKYDFDELSNWTKYHVNKVHVGLIFPWQLFKLVMNTVWRTNWNFSIRKAIVCNFPCFSKNIVRVKRNRKLQYVRDRDRKNVFSHYISIVSLWQGQFGKRVKPPIRLFSISLSFSQNKEHCCTFFFFFFFNIQCPPTDFSSSQLGSENTSKRPIE